MKKIDISQGTSSIGVWDKGNIGISIASYVEADKYKADVELNNRKLKEMGELISSNRATTLSLCNGLASINQACKDYSKELKRTLDIYSTNNMAVYQHIQREILVTIKDTEIHQHWLDRWLNYSWFTKLFRKKYLQQEYQRIVEEANKKFEPMFAENDKALKELKEKITEMEKSHE